MRCEYTLGQPFHRHGNYCMFFGSNDDVDTVTAPKESVEVGTEAFPGVDFKKSKPGWRWKAWKFQAHRTSFFLPLSPVVSCALVAVLAGLSLQRRFFNLLLKVGGAANFQEQVQKVARHSDVGRCG